MVISVARPSPSSGAVAADPARCPRCDSRLRVSYFEPECIHCGYVDYSHRPPARLNNNLMSSGTQYVVRYVGHFPTLSSTVAHIKVHRVRNRVAYMVVCPFCARSMEQTSLSGKRREVREERYKCTQGHRLSLAPSKNGGIGWK